MAYQRYRERGLCFFGELGPHSSAATEGHRLLKVGENVHACSFDKNGSDREPTTGTGYVA